ncbi:MAG: hypothetical protein AB1896_03550, partial [Thermodesulfobacteriota bacterium]
TFFKSLKKNYPNIRLLGVSSRAFHPELGEAFSGHLYACLKRPLDTEELEYWLRSLAAIRTTTREPPGG